MPIANPYTRRWREKNPNYYKDYYLRNRDKLRKCIRKNKLKRIYGLTEADVSRMLTEQSSRCAICSGEMNKVCIDHCHTTKKVRGLLCDFCNKGLGCFKDNQGLLANAIKYLGR